ncbi:hypothetical protein A2U01_0002862 [Trifolium medium]|uniref:Uncharacterized protein n=1 Tax=Trifolium medium TaxID=97028 RepID=A0A392M412_9FABA|nr:hypothetical protein [Trifolium medium]
MGCSTRPIKGTFGPALGATIYALLYRRARYKPPTGGSTACSTVNHLLNGRFAGHQHFLINSSKNKTDQSNYHHHHHGHFIANQQRRRRPHRRHPNSPHREHDIVLSPVCSNEKQVPETDPRDGLETSLSSEDGEHVQVLTERQLGKRPQETQEIQQGPRLDAVERNQRPQRNNSPPRRHHRSGMPPRQENVSQRRPPLERPPQPSKKRDRTPPPREGITSPTTKKGKTNDRPEQRRHSPQGLALMARCWRATQQGLARHAYVPAASGSL